MKAIHIIGGLLVAAGIYKFFSRGNSNTVNEESLQTKAAKADAQTIAEIVVKSGKLVTSGSISDVNANIIFDICENIVDYDETAAAFREYYNADLRAALKAVFDSSTYNTINRAITNAASRKKIFIAAGRSVYTSLRWDGNGYTGAVAYVSGAKYLGRMLKDMGQGVYQFSRYDQRSQTFKNYLVSKFDVVLE